MKTKALILGALPQPHEGPWVDISDGRLWRILPQPEHNGQLMLVVRASEEVSPTEFLLNSEIVKFSGKAARIIILDGFEGPSVTVIIEEVV